MSGGKINPRRIPMSKADVVRAFNDGIDEGFHKAICCILWILKNKMGIEHDTIATLSKELSWLNDAIGEHYLTLADIENAMKEEFDIEVLR